MKKPTTKIVVITSCTGKKSVEHKRQLTLEDFQAGSEHIAAMEMPFSGGMIPAEDLYTGQQHARLMRGVKAFREAHRANGVGPTLDLHILSAGYGLVRGDRKLAPYEATFSGMKVKELRSWAEKIGVPHAFRKALAQPYDLALILLGDSYLKACAIDKTLKLGGPTLLFCGARMSKKLPDLEQMTIVPLSNPDAKRFSCGLLALKGELAARYLSRLNTDATKPPPTKNATELLNTLDNGTKKQGEQTPSRKPPVDFVIQIPKAWHDRPHRNKMRYFVPDWDDQVDPDFDFETDTHSGGVGDWSNQTYAHQMFAEPNYDGLLVSKEAAEKGKKKKKRVNDMGIHRFLRVPPDFPIMGDCGAFGYINEDTPPYETNEILDYYTRLGFDYGVSIDHLIVSATAEEAKFRYDLTTNNAEEFINEHRARGLAWTPVGAIQGWDAESYAAAARKYVQMGYHYIALGGLVRTRTEKLLPILAAVKAEVPDSVDIHLFGIAREGAMADLRRFGINSVDSASALRKAWLGADKNYLTADGWRSAIRIPNATNSFRAKRLVASGAMSEASLRKLESSCLTQIRDYARSTKSIAPGSLVSNLAEYDALIAGHRVSTEDRIRRTLEDRPWAKCPCDICRDVGVEVLIFRGNNRNRRRGFHNTFVFYQLLQDEVMSAGLIRLRDK